MDIPGFYMYTHKINLRTTYEINERRGSKMSLVLISHLSPGQYQIAREARQTQVPTMYSDAPLLYGASLQ